MIERYPGYKGGMSVHYWLGGLFTLSLDWDSERGLTWGALFIETTYQTARAGLIIAFLEWWTS